MSVKITILAQRVLAFAQSVSHAFIHSSYRPTQVFVLVDIRLTLSSFSFPFPLAARLSQEQHKTHEERKKANVVLRPPARVNRMKLAIVLFSHRQRRDLLRTVFDNTAAL